MRQLFLVHFEKDIAAEMEKRANVHFDSEHVFVLNDYDLLVASDSDDVSFLNKLFHLNSKAKESRLGMVFRLNGSYSGYYNEQLVDWLHKYND